MRTTAIMTAGIVAALGAAFAVGPALSDGPANSSANAAGKVTYNSAYALGPDDHAEYVRRQADAAPDREATAKDLTLGYDDGFTRGDRERLAYAGPSAPSLAEESIDVEARRLPNGAPVAVRGLVTAVSGKQMMLERGGMMIRARLPGMTDGIRRGDDVTVFGRISNRGDDLAVRTEAVLLMTGEAQGHLFLSPSRLETVNKRNAPVLRGEARSALAYYRSVFTPL